MTTVDATAALGPPPGEATLRRPELLPVWQTVHGRLSSGRPVTRVRLGPLDETQREALADLLGLDRAEAESLVRTTLFSVEGGQVAAGALLDQGCTGIVCGSDLMALGVVRAARGRGLQVPRDVSVVGFDDSQLIAFTDPPLTTVRQPVQAMAGAAVSALLEEIGGSPVQRTEYVFQPDLVVRGSTAVAAGS